MTETSPNQLARLAQELVAAAFEKQIQARVVGGVAVLLTCPSAETVPALRRQIKDLDLVAPRQDFGRLAQIFESLGAVVRSRGSEEWTWHKDGVEIEVTVPDYVEDYHIDLGPRLALASPTLPLADLLLIKLQRVKFAEKDIQDSIALLLDHSVASSQAEDQIDRAYIARLCGRNWGLFTTVYNNTVALEKMLDRYLAPDMAQLVWQRIELLQSAMDAQPKSLGWMANQIIRRPNRVAA